MHHCGVLFYSDLFLEETEGIVRERFYEAFDFGVGCVNAEVVASFVAPRDIGDDVVSARSCLVDLLYHFFDFTVRHLFGIVFSRFTSCDF